MNKKIIEKIQNKIMVLLPEEYQSKRALLLEDCCSELSRLVASWVFESEKNIRCLVLKGKYVCDTKKSHDILAIVAKKDRIYLIDPTVWQFFPDKKSILIGEYSSLDESIVAVEEKYGGNWQISEKIKNISSEEKEEWLKIIKSNIKDSK